MQIDLQEQRKNDEYQKDSDYCNERFRLACKAEPLSIEFARTCTSAVALLARTVSTFQMSNEIFHALCEGQEDFVSEEKMQDIAKNIMSLLEGMNTAQVMMMLSRLGASCAFTEYMNRLKIEQSKH